MSKKITLFILSALLLFSADSFGQALGDYRSFATGDWENAASWEYFNGSAWVAVDGSVIPVPSSALTDTTLNKVTIQNSHTITVNTNLTVRNVIVNAGSALTLNCTASILSLAYGGIKVYGTLNITGTVTGSSHIVNVNGGSMSVESTGVVNINGTSSTTSTKGFIPVATWKTGATLNVQALGGSAATGWGGGGGQNFCNINFAPTAGTGSFGWGFTAHTVSGDFNVQSTGTTGRLQIFSGSSGTLTVLGKLNVTGASNFTLNGTSSVTYDTLNLYGNVNINTTGNFSISRGSQGSTGTSIINFYSDSVSIAAAAMQNSNSGPDLARFRFVKNGTQYLKFVPTAVTGNALPIEAANGTNLVLNSPVNVTTLYLNNGLITSSAANPLIIGWWTGSALTSGNISALYTPGPASYVNGPMAYLVASASATTKVFTIGKNGVFRPLSLSLAPSSTSVSTFTAEMMTGAPPSNTVPAVYDSVSSKRYYVITESASGSLFTSGTVTLSYGADDRMFSSADARIASGHAAGGGTWIDLGGTGTADTAGTITSTVTFSDLTNTIFVLAYHKNPVPPQAPVLASPAANTTGLVGTVTLKWNKTANAAKYLVQVATDNAFNNLVVNDTMLTDTVKSVTGLLPSTTYYWRAAAANEYGRSSWSTVWNFSMHGYPLQIVLASPLNGLTGQPVAQTFQWRKAENSKAVLTYHFMLATDSLFTNIITNDSTLTDTIKQVQSLQMATKYFWKVRAKNQVGNGPWSAIWNFTTSGLTATIVLAAEWNMISLPLLPSNTAASAIFPAASSPVYSYNNGYTAQTSLTTGLGYWVRYPSAANIQITGSPVSGSITLVAGWNLIGGKNTSTAVSSLTTTPAGIINSYFFGFENGYSHATNLEPGKGYWVRTSQAGTLNFPAGEAKAGTSDAPLADKSWSSITITDRAGHKAILYAGNGSNCGPGQYPMPPVAPAGIFDARFTSQSFVEDLSSSKTVDITGAEYPVLISVRGTDLTIKDNVNGSFLNTVVKSGSTITITDRNINRVELYAAGKPSAYELQQNYPNPFNPSTLIKFSLPFTSSVHVKVFNSLGQVIADLDNSVRQAGSHELKFEGAGLPSGLYIVSVSAKSLETGDNFNAVRKMLLLK